jgi:hypothetical protein
VKLLSVPAVASPKIKLAYGPKHSERRVVQNVHMNSRIYVTISIVFNRFTCLRTSMCILCKKFITSKHSRCFGSARPFFCMLDL